MMPWRPRERMNLNIQDAFGILSQQEAKAITADVGLLCFGLVPACNTVVLKTEPISKCCKSEGR